MTEYGHGLTYRMIGDDDTPVYGAIGEGASDTLAFLLTGSDAMMSYPSNKTNGVRRQRCVVWPPGLSPGRGSAGVVLGKNMIGGRALLPKLPGPISRRKPTAGTRCTPALVRHVALPSTRGVPRRRGLVPIGALGQVQTCNTPPPIPPLRYKGYNFTTYGKISWEEVHDDGEVYAAAMWRVLELYQAAGFTSKDLLYDWVQGMAYTQGNPGFEDMRKGMLKHLTFSQTKGATTAKTCAVWRGFAQFGIGLSATASFDADQISVAESFDVPDECLHGPSLPKSGGAGARAEGATDGSGGPTVPLVGAEDGPSSGDADTRP